MAWKEGVYQFFGILDAMSIIIWLMIIFYLVNKSYSENKHLDHYKYFNRAFLYKTISSLIFSFIYIRIYDGGDSTAYWDTAQKLSQLFFESPSKYFDELFFQGPSRERYVNFDYRTIGLPPNWIYKEDASYFVAKIFSLLSFVTFRSYIAMTLICSYVSFNASWKLFELCLKFKVGNIRNVAIGTLFLPTTAFWCTGISKDMVVYVCVYYILTSVFYWLAKNKSEKISLSFLLKIFVASWMLIHIRDFMFFAVVGPVFYVLGLRWSNKQESVFSKSFIRFLLILVMLFAFIQFMQSEKATEFTTEAQLVQSDLKNNSTYGDNRYDLGISDFSPIGMLKAMPISIYTAFYRPYIWEASSLFVLISAVETFFFLVLTILLVIRLKFIELIRQIFKKEILIFFLLFSLILGFFAGYTSGLFGVLVRFKAPLLPMLFILLTYNDSQN
jgi:hypothetical protein